MRDWRLGVYMSQVCHIESNDLIKGFVTINIYPSNRLFCSEAEFLDY